MDRRLGFFLVLASTGLGACRGTDIYATRPGVGESSLDRLGGEAHIVTASCDITTAVAGYRGLLGSLNPNVVGEQPGGRREINWDAVPALVTNTNSFPADF